MSNFPLLFVTGTARSGTTLLAQMLNAHPSVAVALDPYLPLFRSFRNASIRSNCEASTAGRFVTGPLQDYYFTDERLTVMDAVQAGTLDAAFNASERDDLLTALTGRAGLAAPELVPLLAELFGRTYRELFDRAFANVAEARNARQKRWVGVKEVWSVEFCKPLAAAYPNAKFIVIMRDPRAVVASMHKLAAKDVTQRAHTLSYARHWRKFVGFYDHYLRSDEFRGRLLVIRYEDLVASPQSVAGRLCEFLGIDLEPEMTAANGYGGRSTGSTWRHNSSHDTVGRGIDGSLAARWRTELEPTAGRLVELVCGPEMGLLGYRADGEATEFSEVLEFFMQDHEKPCSWRSDLGYPHLDFQMELERRTLLSGTNVVGDRQGLRRNFLFEDMFKLLRSPERASHNSAHGIGA